MVSYSGDLIDTQWSEEFLFHARRHLYITVRLCFLRGYLRDHFIGGQRKRDRQRRGGCDLFPQVYRPLIGVEETIHTRQVKIELIDRSLLEKRGLCRDDLRHP